MNTTTKTLLIGTGCAAFLITVAIGASNPSPPAPVATPSPTTITVAPAPVAAPTPEPALVAAGDLTNGEWRVGQDVPAGEYRTPGPEEGLVKYCMVTMDPPAAGTLGIKTTSEGPLLITVIDGQVVKVTGCQAFTRQ